MPPDDGVIQAQTLQDPDRLPVLARRDLDLVAALAQELDDRPQHERVRGGGAIDPDPHCLSLVSASVSALYAVVSGESCG